MNILFLNIFQPTENARSGIVRVTANLSRVFSENGHRCSIAYFIAMPGKEAGILIWCGKQLFQLYVYQRISMIALITLFPETVRLHPYVYVSSCLVITLLFAVLIKPLSFNLRQ